MNKSHRSIHERLSPEVRALVKNEKLKKNKVTILSVPEKLPIEIQNLKASLLSLKLFCGNGFVVDPNSSVSMSINVTARQIDRSIAIIYTLYSELKARGVTLIIPNAGHGTPFVLLVRDQSIRFRLTESYEYYRPLDWSRYSNKEQLEGGLFKIENEDAYAVGELSFILEDEGDLPCRTQWHSNKHRPLENQLNNFIAGIFIQSESLRLRQESQAIFEKIRMQNTKIEAALREEAAIRHQSNLRKERVRRVVVDKANLLAENRRIKKLSLELAEKIKTAPTHEIKRLERFALLIEEYFLKNDPFEIIPELE